MTEQLTIAIDGTAGSGKGTIAKAIASEYHLDYLDTGRLYRFIGAQMLENQIDPIMENIDRICAFTQDISSPKLDNPFLDKAEIGVAASKVAVLEPLRKALYDFQRHFALRSQAGAILDGRDIGTIILPEAKVKLYVDAGLPQRAQRRFAQLQLLGANDVDLESLTASLAQRDHRDKNRSSAPLKPAKDAQLIDTTDLTIEQAVAQARAIVEKFLAQS